MNSVLFNAKMNELRAVTDDYNEQVEEESKNSSKSEKQLANKKPKLVARVRSREKIVFTHKWLAGTLKGHSSPILDMDFSPNGKYVITVAEDRSLMLWSTKEFEQKEHKAIRGNVDLDHGSKVKFSPDSKAFIVSLGNANTVRVFRIGKKEDGSPGNITGALDFPQKHKAQIINIGIASSGKFIMSISSDTTMIVWSIKGDVLSEINTNHMNNSYGAVSPCGRFVASSGFTPDVKVWEVCFTKSGEFHEVRRAFELKGHAAGVHCFSFNHDSTRMASASKDGTWKYWDTNIRYDMNQDPYLLFTGSLKWSGPCIISLSPDGRTVAMAQHLGIYVCNSSGQDEEVIENVHSEISSQLGFDNSGKYLLSAGDKQVHVLHNITGYKATIEELVELEKKANGQAMKERIRSQITDARSFRPEMPLPCRTSAA
ncbi:transducin beta-like protein 2 isoform X2 [Dreissena polymorpha]|uniref:transducin beta-like protein 2 isoform X2 n=1 Tax=Dreissena polymorpha TaxID=45954 RepID=UPI0022640B79|nr:transducin beta-like protein 2 isoform X2 [Dreissena polymorpha]